MMKKTWIVFFSLIICFLVFSENIFADGTARGLFINRMKDNPDVPRHELVERHRFVDVRFELFDLGKVDRDNKGASLELNLFDDTVLKAIRDRIERNKSGGVAWIGHIDGEVDSSVTFVVEDQRVSGTITMQDTLYHIRHIKDNLHVIRDIDTYGLFVAEKLVVANMLEPLESEVLDLVNRERKIAGLNPLDNDDRLTRAARGHSEDMAQQNYFSHTSLDGRSPGDRIKAEGYSGFTYGENIAAGYSTPVAVMNAWMNSPGHRANILNPSFCDIGVGHATGGSFRDYWTQNFGCGADTPSTPTPSVAPTATPTPSAAPTATPTPSAAPTATPTPSETPTATPTSQGNSFESEVFKLVNQERRKAGLDLLSNDTRLASSARKHSKDMAQQNFFSHTSLDGRTPGDRIKAEGYSGFTYGENIAAGFSTPESVMEVWMNSPGHRANILNPDFCDIGVGYAEGGNFRHYWTQNFGCGADTPSTPTPTPTSTATPSPPQDIQIETGEVSIDHNWTTVGFTKSFTDPIVVVKPFSLNGGHPGVIRIRNVSSTGFEVRLQEWQYLDGQHTLEAVGFLIMERGKYTLNNGKQIIADRFDTNQTSTFDNILFDLNFQDIPVVVTSISTFNGSDTVTGRIRNISRQGFEFIMQEQESNSQSHTTETINYIACPPSSDTINGVSFKVATTGNIVTHSPRTIPFGETFNPLPVFISDMQTTNGRDTSNLRWKNKTMSSIDVLIDEEQSLDSETGHISEEVGYILFSQ